MQKKGDSKVQFDCNKEVSVLTVVGQVEILSLSNFRIFLKQMHSKPVCKSWLNPVQMIKSIAAKTSVVAKQMQNVVSIYWRTLICSKLFVILFSFKYGSLSSSSLQVHSKWVDRSTLDASDFENPLKIHQQIPKDLSNKERAYQIMSNSTLPLLIEVYFTNTKFGNSKTSYFKKHQCTVKNGPASHCHYKSFAFFSHLSICKHATVWPIVCPILHT